ncbi:DUF1430 domain-containing protein [Priestia megaterium]|uniref:DUF1430 domain-containing protein n=1 Tax=Priestia megaterium TaxID=1404 RepID=UPI0034E20FA4
MKIFKFVISFIVIFIGMMIIGESKIFQVDNFYSEFTSTTLYLQPDTMEKEMKKDIINSAQKNQVEVFSFKRFPHSTYNIEINIYGTSNVKEYLEEHLNIMSKEYNSIFLGNININFSNLNDIKDIKDVHDFYVIGSKSNIHEFKMDLIDKYAGNHPQEGYKNNDIRNTILTIWFLVAVVILLLTFYEINKNKKELLVRIVNGAKISNIVLRNILLDSLVLISLFIIVLLLLKNYTNVFYRFDISLTFFLLILLLNSALYLKTYFLNLKEAFSNIKGSHKLLSVSYALKLITAIVTTLVISSNIAIMFDSYSLYKQKSFFKHYSDYYYTRINYKNILESNGENEKFVSSIDKSIAVQDKFYKKFFQKFDATLLSKTFDINDNEGIIANKNSYPYLSSKIKSLKSKKLNQDYYFLVPKALSNTLKEPELNEMLSFYGRGVKKRANDVIFYEDNINLVSIDENLPYYSKIAKNPIILFLNVDEKRESKQLNSQLDLSYSTDIMYKISEGAFNTFIKQNDLENQIVTVTNVWENYEHKWNLAKRLLIINFIFSMLILFLEATVIYSIIKMEYEINAIELSIKKTLGHSAFGRNLKLISITIITFLVSIISTVLISKSLDIHRIPYLVIGGVSILLLELLVIFFYIRKVEKNRIPKILKGGNL